MSKAAREADICRTMPKIGVNGLESRMVGGPHWLKNAQLPAAPPEALRIGAEARLLRVSPP